MFWLTDHLAQMFVNNVFYLVFCLENSVCLTWLSCFTSLSKHFSGCHFSELFDCMAKYTARWSTRFLLSLSLGQLYCGVPTSSGALLSNLVDRHFPYTSCVTWWLLLCWFLSLGMRQVTWLRWCLMLIFVAMHWDDPLDLVAVVKIGASNLVRFF